MDADHRVTGSRLDSSLFTVAAGYFRMALEKGAIATTSAMRVAAAVAPNSSSCPRGWAGDGATHPSQALARSAPHYPTAQRSSRHRHQQAQKQRHGSQRLYLSVLECDDAASARDEGGSEEVRPVLAPAGVAARRVGPAAPAPRPGAPPPRPATRARRAALQHGAGNATARPSPLRRGEPPAGRKTRAPPYARPARAPARASRAAPRRLRGPC